MKKRLFALLFVIIGSMFLTGCGNKPVYVVGEVYKFNIEFKDSYITKSHEYDDGHYFYLNDEDESPYLEIPSSSKLILEYIKCKGEEKEKIGSYEGCLTDKGNMYTFVVPYVFTPKEKELGYGFKFVGRTKEDVEKLVKKTSNIKYIGLIEKTSNITKDWLYK